MFGFGKKNLPAATTEAPDAAAAAPTQAPVATEAVTPPEPPRESAPEPPPERKGFLQRLRSGLAKTSQVFTGEIFRRKIDDALFEELEERLLLADVGVEATQRILRQITHAVKRGELKDGDALLDALEQAMVDLLEPVQQPLLLPDAVPVSPATRPSTLAASLFSRHPSAVRSDPPAPLPPPPTPFSILVVGVNGAGKTTTIGKLAHRLQAEGRSVLLAAGDTFRAAAVEQLQTWGQRISVPVIAQGPGADSASVIFDALQAAHSRKMDVLIADTAGRLHTQHNLMEEIRKVKRVMSRLDANAPQEVLLVLDGGTGQNAMHQLRQFHATLGVTGLVITKLDGTAKGGVLLAMAAEFAIPIRFIGVGESVADLQPFEARAFARALLGRS
jgi:fused signal recognition particle receptor